MKHDKLRVTKIVEELINYFFSLGISDMDININETDEYYKIHFFVHDIGACEGEIERLDKMLHVQKQEDMEEYYWFLAGDCDVDTELTLVGMMVDRSEVRHVEGNNLEINLYRNKK